MEKVYLGFNLDDKIFGVAAEDVLRVSQIVEITSIPKAPKVVKGIINVMGEVVPVIDIRNRLNLPSREIHLSDYLIIIRCKNQTISIIVDGIMGLIPALTDNDVPLKNVIGDSPLIERVIKQADGFILIINTQKLLNVKESKKIQKLVDRQNEKIYGHFAQVPA